jgi:hypothetical protein
VIEGEIYAKKAKNNFLLAAKKGATDNTDQHGLIACGNNEGPQKDTKRHE